MISVLYIASVKSIKITLEPGKDKTLKNPLFWGLSAHCHIQCTGENQLVAKIIKGTGTLNGKAINAAGLTLNVKNGDHFDITASASASVNMINNGKNVVHAECSLAHSRKAVFNPDSKEMDVDIIELVTPGKVDLVPSVSLTVSNPMPTIITATCKIRIVDPEDVITIKAKQGNSRLNGYNLTDKVTLRVRDYETITFTTAEYSTLIIKNKGRSTAHMDCKLGEENELIETLVKGFLVE